VDGKPPREGNCIRQEKRASLQIMQQRL
jgi:hypothetical protein